MTTRGPAEPCRGYHFTCTVNGEAFRNVAHCPGCAEAASLRELLEIPMAGEPLRHEVHLVGPGIEPVRAFLTDAEESWIHLLGERKTALDARATAAEGERDRLREALKRCVTGSATDADAFSDARAALAAIPHTEGEASAPPKENP